MATLQKAVDVLTDSGKYKSVQLESSIGTEMPRHPDFTEHVVHLIEANGHRAVEKKMKFLVYKVGIQGEEKAYLAENQDGGDEIEGNLKLRFKNAIIKLMVTTGGKAWRKIELDVENGYADCKVFIEETAPTENTAGVGEWKFFTVIENADDTDPQNIVYTYDVYSIPEIAFRTPDRRKNP